jgi:hypothetical protein
MCASRISSTLEYSYLLGTVDAGADWHADVDAAFAGDAGGVAHADALPAMLFRQLHVAWRSAVDDALLLRFLTPRTGLRPCPWRTPGTVRWPTSRPRS